MTYSRQCGYPYHIGCTIKLTRFIHYYTVITDYYHLNKIPLPIEFVFITVVIVINKHVLNSTN